MREVGRGARVIEHPPVRGEWRTVTGPADVAVLPRGVPVVAVVKEPGALYLRAVLAGLVAVVCLRCTPRSHVGILTSAAGVPCVVSPTFPDGAPADGTEVEIDCSGEHGVIRA